MYDRILELIAESSAARRAETRAKLASKASRSSAVRRQQPSNQARSTSLAQIAADKEEKKRANRVRNRQPYTNLDINNRVSSREQPKQATSPETLKAQASRVGKPGNRTKPTKGPAKTSKTALSKAAKKAIMAKGKEATKQRGVTFDVLKQPRAKQDARKAELQKKFSQEKETGSTTRTSSSKQDQKYKERPSQKFYDRVGKVIPGVAKLSAAIKGERERRMKKGKEGKDPRTAYERGLAGRGETVVGRLSRALRSTRSPERALEKPSGSVY